MNSRQNSYKSISWLMVILAGGLFAGNGETNNLESLIIRQPISCKVEDIHYSRDIETRGEWRNVKGGDVKSSQEIYEEAKQKSQEEIDKHVSAKGHSEVNTVISSMGSGSIEGRSHFELNTGIGFSMTKKKETDAKINEGINKVLQEKYYDVTKSTASDWKLQVLLQFKNNKPDKNYTINSNSFVYIEIEGKKIKIPIGKDIFLDKKGVSKAVPISVKVNDEEIRQLLFVNKHNKSLDSKNVKLIVDDNFEYRENDSEVSLVHAEENNPISIFVDFGPAKDESPVKIVSFSGKKRTTYDQALKAMNKALEKKVPALFGFNNNGDLEKIYELKFGEPEKNKIIFVRDSGQIKCSFSAKDLREQTKRSEKTELHFEQVSLSDIAENQKEYKGVISNCLAFIDRQKSEGQKLSFEEKYCAALLYFGKREFKRSYEYFSLMESDDYQKMNANDKDKDMVLSLSIKYGDDDSQSFKKLIENISVTNKTAEQLVEFSIDNDKINVYKALTAAGFDMLDKNERTALGFAAEFGKVNFVKWFIEGVERNRRRPVDEVFKDGDKTPLLYAAINGHFEVCKFLVDMGADINRKFKEKGNDDKIGEYDQLVDQSYNVPEKIRKYIQAERDSKAKGVDRLFRIGGVKPDVELEEIKKWYKAGVPPYRYLGGGWTLYGLAVDSGSSELVLKMVAEYGTNTPVVVEGKGEVYGVNPNKKLGASLFLKKHPNGKSAQRMAVEQGNTNLIVALCKNVNEDESQCIKDSMLKYALNLAEEQKYAIEKYCVLRCLIDIGADLQTKSEDNEITPLMWAVWMNDVDMVKRLMGKGIDINATHKETGRKAICYAIEKGYDEIVKILLPKTDYSMIIKGDDVWDEQNFYQFVASRLKNEELLRQIFIGEEAFKPYPKKRTPLMCAAYAGNFEAVKFLVEKSLNVDIEAQDDCWIGTGKTALDYANEQGHKKVVELLQGKKVNHE